MFETAAILAPGLLGASLGKAMRERDLAKRIQVWARRPETRVQLAEEDFCDFPTGSVTEAVTNADVVFICAPVSHIHRLCIESAPALKPGAWVTDVGSTKSLIARRCHAAMPEGTHFIGSHPMAGSERSGLEASRADLFEERPCILTPLEETSVDVIEQASLFWSLLGMRVSRLSPERHDELIAQVSHLPHVSAAGVAAWLGRQSRERLGYAGPGLRDHIRIAGGSPSLWVEILQQNREEVLRSLEGVIDELSGFRAELHNEDWGALEHRLQLAQDCQHELSRLRGTTEQ